jgi:integrase
MGKTTRRQRGEGALYFRESDCMWVGSVDLGHTPDGKRRRKVVTHSTQAGALKKLNEVKRAVGIHGDVPTRSQTLGEWLDRWLMEIAQPRVRPRTLDTYRHKVGLIKAAIGRVRLDRLTPAHVRQMQDHAGADGRSSTTALQAHRILAKALKDAEREGLVVRNVATLTDAPRKAVSTRTALSAGDARSVLVGSAADPLAARWALAILCGVRQGEALGLRWEYVDLDVGVADLAWQLQRLTWRHDCGGTCGRKRGAECPDRSLMIPAGFEAEVLRGGLCLTRPKSEDSRRIVPLPSLVVDLLGRHRALTAQRPNPFGLVWTDGDGMPVDPKDDRAAWGAALTRAGVAPVVLHAARHTTATLLMNGGTADTTIQSIMGHSDVTTTQKYQHADLRIAREAIERLAGELTATLPPVDPEGDG